MQRTFLTTSLIALSALALTAMAPRTFSNLSTDDSDISGKSRGTVAKRLVPAILTPDEIVAVKTNPGQISARFVLQRNGEYVALEGLTINDAKTSTASTNAEGIWASECDNSLDLMVTVARPGRFQIHGDNGNYGVHVQLECGSDYEVRFHEGTNAGQLMSVYEVVSRAERRLEAAIGLDFWSQNLNVVWPGDGDYYNWGTLNVTEGHHWDVVAHELGHGIYDLGNLGGWGGGQHRIDECYSEGMALSEGWASFFAGWLYVGLDHPDAHFQYLVPRRAPIQFENIPADVCQGPRNEWRVIGFFWDLVDLHNDGEAIERVFAETWNALSNNGAGGPTDAARLLYQRGFDEQILRQSWDINFQTEFPSLQ